MTQPPGRPVKRSDIDDTHVVELAYAWQRDPYRVPPVWDALIDQGAPRKVVLRKLEHLCDRGLLSFGVSIRYCWPTPEGLALLGLPPPETAFDRVLKVVQAWRADNPTG